MINLDLEVFPESARAFVMALREHSHAVFTILHHESANTLDAMVDVIDEVRIVMALHVRLVEMPTMPEGLRDSLRRSLVEVVGLHLDLLEKQAALVEQTVAAHRTAVALRERSGETVH